MYLFTKNEISIFGLNVKGFAAPALPADDSNRILTQLFSSNGISQQSFLFVNIRSDRTTVICYYYMKKLN